MYALTKMDLAALRKGDEIAVHLIDNKGTVRVIKRRHASEKDPFAHDLEHVIAAPVNDYKTGSQPSWRKYFSMFYISGRGHAGSIMRSLRLGDEIEFCFWPDAHSNDYMRRADLHADVLFLRVHRGKEWFEYEMNHSLCPDNSARMCKGYVPFTKESEAA